jgi:predicted secreted acid phosphatase
MKRHAIIVDIDGTLANNPTKAMLVEQQKIDWNQFTDMSKYDTVNEWCLEIVKAFGKKNFKIIFLTRRSEMARKVTTDWLTINVGMGIDWELLMSGDNDTEPDWILKRRVYEEKIRPFYDVLFCMDDKMVIANMWRSIGLTCLHVASY